MTTKRVDTLSPGFSDDDSPPASNLSSMQRAIVTIQKLRGKVELLERGRTEPIAIIGMACRFPGGGNTPEAFFQELVEGIDAVTEIPPNRWQQDPAQPTDAEARAVRWGAFLRDIDYFDAQFFNISPREASKMDPQQRLLLEVTFEALERAGQVQERLVGSRTGVFLGIMNNDYAELCALAGPIQEDTYTTTGNGHCFPAGRVSYTFGFQGPCIAIDTACSSSLVAVHLACQSLRNGECSMAVAGGVNLMLVPSTSRKFARTQALSPDGHCKSFDATANGFVRGEGCGMIVLKRLSDAERDGDLIIAVIRGSAINQDGRSTGLTAPNVRAQQAMLSQALANARVAASEIGYVETHGTGTPLGDPIEMEALTEILGAPRQNGAPCFLGAVKTNIGHLEAAAGVAGIIKTALVLQRGIIPRNIHFRTLNPRIRVDSTPFVYPEENTTWTTSKRRIAGVSSFGMSGTNAHAILEEWPTSAEEDLSPEDNICLLPLSAKTPNALRSLVSAYRDYLVNLPGDVRIKDVVHSASIRRSHYEHRLSFVGGSRDEFINLFNRYIRGEAPTGVVQGKSTPARAKIVFVFTGQGSQWLGMGRQLYETDSSFRSVIDTCDNLMTPRLGWSILDELDATEATSRLAETQVAQPLLFAVQIALVEMLRSWGISPDAMIGYGAGEISAAHIAGILSLDEAIRLVTIRGRTMQKATGMGKMVAVSMTLADATTMLAGYEDRVSIAAINDPESIILSGQLSAVDDVVTRCEKRNYKVRPLPVNYAFHSPQMDVFEQELVERLTRVDARRATLAMYSTLLADCVDGKELNAHYWGRNIRGTVDFSGAVSAAIRDGYQLFLEVGPHPELVKSIQGCLSAKKADGYVVGTLRHGYDDRRALLETAGGLYTRGCAIEWARILPSGGRCAPLPTYPWQRERFWVESAQSAAMHMETGVGPLPEKTAHRSKVVFIFPGQGSQWLGMGQELLAGEPAFRAALEACDEAIRKEADFSVLAELQADDLTSRLDEIDVVQPLLFAIEVALAQLWQSKGIKPDCVVGHSMGEIAAAHIAGILTLDDAAKVICRRSRLLTRIQGLGAMALVELPLAEAESAIAHHKTKLGIAVSNGPRSTVVSGDAIALDEVLAMLEARGVYCKHVKVDIASHSPQVDPLLNDLRACLRDVHGASGTVRMQSTVTTMRLTGNEVDAAYWADNLRQPVRFSEVTQNLLKEGFDIFIEISPHPILVPSLEENLKETHSSGIVIASLRRQAPEQQTLQEALDTVFRHGHRHDATPHAQHEHRVSKARHGIDEAHPLLGWSFVPAAQPELHVWEIWLSVEAFPYLASHRVQGEVVFPAAGFVEMALAAGRQVYNDRRYFLDDISFAQMLAISKEEARIVQLSLLEEGGGRAVFTISSKPDGAKDWVQHVTGTLRLRTDSGAEPGLVMRANAEAQCPDPMSSQQHYEHMLARGLAYGAEFQGITDVRRGNDETVARVRMPESITHDAASYLIHPALLDACFQAALWSAPSRNNGTTYVPIRATGVRFFGRIDRDAWVHARRAEGTGEGEIAASIVVRDDHGRVLLEIGALHLQALTDDNTRERDPYADCTFEVVWRKRELSSSQSIGESAGGSWLVLADDGGFGAALTEQLRADGADRVVEVVVGSDYASLGGDRYKLDPTRVEHWTKLLTSAFGKTGFRAAIHCSALDASPWQSTSEATLMADLRNGPWSVLRLTQSLLKQGWRDTPKLYLLTRGAQTLEQDTHTASVAQSTLWGLGRVMAMEQPDLGCVRIDLAPTASPNEPALVLRELISGGDEDQVALRSNGRYAARLVRDSLATPKETPERIVPAAGRPYRLEISKPGVLERLALRPHDRRAPEPDEVEIEVEAAGLNFLDVLFTLGVLPDDNPEITTHGPRLGMECAGRIVRLGEAVNDLAVGQEVIALAPSAMATHVIAKRELVISKPRQMDWAEAATTPIVFMTAYYALRHVGQLQKSERVLIHAGAGGVGMAAIQVAQYIGAEIFATAGTDEKRALLRGLGVPHVLDSRSLSFVDDIRRITNGEGIDVVLNSLAGEFLHASFELLRDHGRFVEIGKRDYHENRRLGLRPFLKNLSYSLVDLRGMISKRPERVRALLKEVMDLFDARVLTSVPCRVLPLSNAIEAFTIMAQAKHIGKLALAVREQNVSISWPAPSTAEIRSNGTYLITGGLGGLGLTLATWLVQRGARHIALVGRSSPSVAANAAIGEMRDAGAAVGVYLGNVGQSADVRSIFKQIERDMPPLRGIVHAAGLLDDRTILEMSEAEFFHPMEPKVFGSWNLHEAAREKEIDFFVMYSSAAGLLGSPGQANYAAANTFLDALCHARAANGLPATSIQWGAFAEVGLAAAKDVRGKRLAARGSASLKPEDGPALFARVIAKPRVEVGLMHFDVRQWVEFYPQIAGAPFLSELAKEGATPAAGNRPTTFREIVDNVSAAQRSTTLEQHLLEQLGKVLRLDPKRIDKTAPFTTLGVDSLMSLELRNRLEASLGLKLSAALLFTYSTTIALTTHLIGKLFSAAEPQEVVAPATLRAPTGMSTDAKIKPSEPEAAPSMPEETALVDKLEAFEEYLK